MAETDPLGRAPGTHALVTNAAVTRSAPTTSRHLTTTMLDTDSSQLLKSLR
jgi:hypothetical protein